MGLVSIRLTYLAHKDCLKFFRLLPIGNLIDIRTARFLEDFIINENYVCRLFARNAKCSLDKIFSMYSDNIQVV